MTVGTYSNASSYANTKYSLKTKERLLAMEDQRFFRLNCDDSFSPAGSLSVEWDFKSIQQALGRTEALASDPAKGGKITDGSIEEAAVALTAERQHIFEHATRESTGSAEFIDEKGVAWDVKSPLSPPPGQNWSYSPDHQVEKIRHDLGQGDRVLFNLSRVNDKDRDDTLTLLKQELTCEERSQILILTDAEVGSVA